MKVAVIVQQNQRLQLSDEERKGKGRTVKKVIVNKKMMMTKKKKRFGSIQSTLNRTGRTITTMNVDDNSPKVMDEVINPLDLPHHLGGQGINIGGKLLGEEDNLVSGHFLYSIRRLFTACIYLNQFKIIVACV